ASPGAPGPSPRAPPSHPLAAPGRSRRHAEPPPGQLGLEALVLGEELLVDGFGFLEWTCFDPGPYEATDHIAALCVELAAVHFLRDARERRQGVLSRRQRRQRVRGLRGHRASRLQGKTH